MADCDEIVYEYEQHFAFKLKDGYSEEEISAKLGNPADIAGQYDKNELPQRNTKKIFTLIGLGILDFFAFIFYIVLICFGIGIPLLSCREGAGLQHQGHKQFAHTV